MKHTGPFPINQMFDDMRKVSLSQLRESDPGEVAKHYGLSLETVKHWVGIVISLKG